MALPDFVPTACVYLVGFYVVRYLLGCCVAVYAHMLRGGKNLKKFGDWAVVTGATDGIGQALAFNLASKGLNVMLLSRTESKLKATAAAISERYPNISVETVAVDFGNFSDELQATVAESLEGKAVAVLINNVGMSYPFCKYFHELTASEADAMVELNVNSTSKMTYLVLPGMLKAKKGCVVNMSSAAAQNPSPLLSQYSGTKGYVEHFTASMAQEYAPKGLKFQVQSPLFVTTKLAKINKPSLFVPTPTKFAKASVAFIGQPEVHASPYWAHALQLWIMASVPTFVLDSTVISMHHNIRRKGIAKEARKAMEGSKKAK